VAQPSQQNPVTATLEAAPPVPTARSEQVSPIRSIAEVARELCVSPQTLRYYEKEGLFLVERSAGGRRVFFPHDVARLRQLRSWLVSRGLNVAGVQQLLGAVPCWELVDCPVEVQQICDQRRNDRMPCWGNSRVPCRIDAKTCRQCVVYRRAPELCGKRHVLRVSDP